MISIKVNETCAIVLRQGCLGAMVPTVLMAGWPIKRRVTSLATLQLFTLQKLR